MWEILCMDSTMRIWINEMLSLDGDDVISMEKWGYKLINGNSDYGMDSLL
jgi:hypothetical protein